MRQSLEQKKEAFGRLLGIMDRLRAECPWDRKQTIQSLRILTIEETYELADAILKNDIEELKEEVGDVMLHLVFYAKMADELNAWDIGDALDYLCEKLIRRHPHIYGDVNAEDEETVKKNWENIKLSEGKKSVLSGVPVSLPAMVKAYRMQDKTRQVGFEWDNESQVWDKLMEEMHELRETLLSDMPFEKKEEEFGDVLFSMINFARFHNIDPETALEKINQKFKRRFEYIENNAGQPLTSMTLAQMDELWNEAKAKERAGNI